MAAQYYKINYKSDFVLTINSDAGWAVPFCIKFWTGMPLHGYFAGFDGENYVNCRVGETPTQLLVMFDDHHMPVGPLRMQIAYHTTIEEFPDRKFDEVTNPTNVTVDIDGTEYQVMLDLNGETAPEIEFNLPAYANEAQRIANENQRIANEAQRIANEEQRIANEEQRISNEEQRIAAESIRIANEESRISEFAQLKHDAEIATADANAAATLANEKAALAAEKAALSQAAAELANAKATLAQQKADYAQTQGDYAKAQGDYAKEQGDIAEADHERAESDHTRAENDHTAVEVYVDSLGAFDISAYHATGGVLAKYVDLSAALDGGDNIPEAIRKGGMSVKFVQSSDNKYVQYRLKTTEFSTNENDWVGEELEISNIPSTNELYICDKNKNVVLVLKNGHILTKNFSSAESVNQEYVLDVYNVLKQLIDQANLQIANKQDKGNYVTYSVGRDNTRVYIKDDEGNVVALIGNGHIKTGKFDSSKSLIQTQKGKENLYFTDLFGNVVVAVKNGDIRTSNFDSKVTRLLAENCYERVVLLEQDSDLEKRKMIPAISWVDDDFDTSRMSYLTIMRNWCNAHDIHGDIALIPDSTIVAIPDSEHKDITDVYFKPERLALLQEFENEGFEFLVHPPHYGLYEGGGWNIVETDEYIRKNFAMTVRCFLKNGIYPDILVYPGGSGGVDAVKECARKYFTCAITPSGGAVGNPRTSYSSTRYKLPRLPIVISQDNTVTMIKNQIATALSNNEWVILNSHVWMFSGDGTEATDETSMSFANLFDIITYANTLQKIKPVREVWRTRQILWDYYRNY